MSSYRRAHATVCGEGNMAEPTAEMHSIVETCRQTRQAARKSREEMHKTQLKVQEASRKELDRSWNLIVRSKRLLGA
jgi:hypothetical protein